MGTPHIIGAAAVLIAGAAVGGWYVGRHQAPEPPPAEDTPTPAAAAPADPLDWRARFDYEDVLPEYIEPDDAPRAPVKSAFGFSPGQQSLAEVERWITQRKLICKDTSVRAMMADYRDKKVAEIRKAQAEGNADGASGASWLYRSTKHEKNPQVRLVCEKVRMSIIGDRERDDLGPGRLMFIFDSEDQPLRRIILQRRYADDAHAAARKTFTEAEAAMRAALGEPAVARGTLPAEGEEFVRNRSIRREWAFADIGAKVSALRLKNGVTIYEEFGVPSPVRPDAPTLPESEGAAAAATP